MRPRSTLAIGIVIVVALALVSEATPTTPGRNGLIVYAQELRPERFQLFTIHPDGTGKRQITHLRSAANADWSPNGRRLVFEIDNAHGPAFCSVELANADGSGLVDLTGKRNGCEGQPAFMPNGRRIVFVRFDDKTEVESIWSMNLSGGDRRPITPRKGSGVTDPNVSPDGKWITYVRIKKEGKLQALFAVRPDGSRLHQLTPYAWEVAIKHDWSPDGKLIVVTTNADFVRPHESANLVTIRPNGSGMTQVTHFTGAKENAFAGSFSPDGKQIVFRLEQGDTYSLAVIGRDGGSPRTLTTGRDKPRFIDWGTHP